MIELSDRYSIQQQLGKKAGRKTVLAHDNETQELVVIKILSFNSDFEWDDLRLFEREAKTLQSLNHPAIPRYLDYFELNSPTGKEFALVQSYIPAKSLDQHLKAGRNFSEAEVKELAKSLLEILIYLHEKQPPIIHRDIKPSNILLGDRSGHSIGQVYLVDFGSVQNLAAKESGTMTVVGTYGYMPPEQFGDRRFAAALRDRAVPASDLYSLGATLIYLVTGSHPADLPQIDLVIQFDQATNLTPEFSYWLERMTEPSLNRRFYSVEKALQGLEKPSKLTPSFTLSSTLTKPPRSRIIIRKSNNTLEIFCSIGKWKLTWKLLKSSALAIAVSLLVSSTFSPKNPMAIFPSILILLGGGGIAVRFIRDVIFRYFGNIHIYFNEQQLTVTCKLFGLNHKSYSLPRDHIYNLVYKTISREANALEHSDSGYINESYLLIRSTGSEQYELCSEKTVTRAELYWLSQEISDWLEIPVIKEEVQ